MASSAWKGFLTFGLISIPIRLYPAARSARTYLHQIHKECNTRIKQPLFCPTCNRIVDRSEIIKGYEYEDGRYVLIEGDEIKKITPPSGRTMEILAFVKQEDIDPIYFDSSYFVIPEDEGKKAYQLLLKALEDTKRVAIAKLTMHQREYTVFIRPRNHGLTLHTMYFANEIREVAEYGKAPEVKLKPQEIKLAEQLVETLSADFKPEQYHDEFQERLKALIEAKLKGREVAPVAEPRRAPVIDMMEALKKSLAASGSTQQRQAKPGPVAVGRRPRRRAAG
jgi:DNA end-binding protein Ku